MIVRTTPAGGRSTCISIWPGHKICASRVPGEPVMTRDGTTPDTISHTALGYQKSPSQAGAGSAGVSSVATSRTGAAIRYLHPLRRFRCWASRSIRITYSGHTAARLLYR